MKLKTIIGSAVALTLGLGGVAFAAGDYFAPERMHCKIDNAGKLSCSDFNRSYLTEDTHTAQLPPGKDLVFNFATGAAYFDEGSNAWTVFFTYKDTSSKNVKLRSVNTSIQPDLKNGAWKKNKDIYTCTAGYMSCPITNLPVKS
jgi:hypothetical protein